MSKVPVPPDETTSHDEAGSPHPSRGVDEGRHRLAARSRLTLAAIADRLQVSLVAHDAAERRAARRHDATSQRDGLVAGRDATSVLTHIHINEHTNSRAGRRAAEASASIPATESTATVIAIRSGQRRYARTFAALTISLAISTSSQSSATTSASRTVAQVNPDARSGRELPSGDLGGLVRLEVRAQSARAAGEERRHPRDVPIEGRDDRRSAPESQSGMIAGDARRRRSHLLHPRPPRRHDAERAHLAIQVAALDAEHFRGARHVALLRGERAQNVLLLELVARIVQRRDRRRLVRRCLRPVPTIPCSRKVRSRDETRSPGTMIISRSTRFRSSRTFPGHGYRLQRRHGVGVERLRPPAVFRPASP